MAAATSETRTAVSTKSARGDGVSVNLATTWNSLVSSASWVKSSTKVMTFTLVYLCVCV